MPRQILYNSIAITTTSRKIPKRRIKARSLGAKMRVCLHHQLWEMQTISCQTGALSSRRTLISLPATLSLAINHRRLACLDSREITNYIIAVKRKVISKLVASKSSYRMRTSTARCSKIKHRLPSLLFSHIYQTCHSCKCSSRISLIIQFKIRSWRI